MTTQTIIHLTFGSVFILGLFIASLYRISPTPPSPPLSKADLLRRSGIRLGCCTLPYLVLASLLWALDGNDVLFRGFWFWSAVILVPGLGLALDLSRLPDPTPNDRHA